MSTRLATSGGSANISAMAWPRWRLVLLLMAVCFMAHFNRVGMSVAGTLRIMDQYEITPTDMGWVYSSFLIAYTLFMLPGGWLIDRRGPRFALWLMCGGSAVFVVLTGGIGLLAGSATVVFMALIVIRSLMGMVSAPLHPAAAKSVAIGIPLARRSLANGLVTGAALLGVAGTYILFGEMIDHFDWPIAFLLAGCATLIVGVLWRQFGIEESEVSNASDVSRGAEPHVTTSTFTSNASWLDWLKRNKNLLLLTFSYGCVGYFQYVFFYWMEYYFGRVLKLGEERSQFYAAIPPLAMAIGMPLGGWISDRMFTRFGWRAARAGLAGSAMAASALLLMMGIQMSQPTLIVVWFSLALGVLGMAEGPFWATAVEAGGRRGGLSASIFNTGGNAGGILAPVVTPWISDALEFGWVAGIAVTGAICLVGAVVWYWIDLDPGVGSPDHEYPPTLQPPLDEPAQIPAF